MCISSALITCSVCDPPFPSLRRLPCPLQPLPIPHSHPPSPPSFNPTSFHFSCTWMNLVELSSIGLIIYVFAFSGECRALPCGSVSNSRHKAFSMKRHRISQLMQVYKLYYGVFPTWFVLHYLIPNKYFKGVLGSSLMDDPAIIAQQGSTEGWSCDV